MESVERLLGRAPAAAGLPRKAPYILRPPQPGDLGWIVHRHGALYAQDYGWDDRFEALVAGIVADFVAKFDAARERSWIAQNERAEGGYAFGVRPPHAVTP